MSWARGEFFADLSYFSNAVNNYIYLQDESEEEHEEHEDEEHEGEDHHDHGGWSYPTICRKMLTSMAMSLK